HIVPYNSICSRCGAFFLVNLFLPVVKFPPVEYPSPETVTNWLLTYIPFTVILFSVIVPVLSVQMIDAQPKVSTAFNLRTTARQLNAVETLRSEEHTSELQSRFDLVCRLLLEKKKNI